MSARLLNLLKCEPLVPQGNSKKEEKSVQVAFFFPVKRKILSLAATSLSEDLANLEEHFCLHEPRA